MKIKHPNAAPHSAEKLYDIATVLFDLSSQEGCDGVPYDQMHQAAAYIRRLETRNELYRRAIQSAVDIMEKNGNMPTFLSSVLTAEID